MENEKLKSILYLIALVIVSTICIQVYWNYKNYQINKQQLINDVQISLDNATNGYYEDLAKHTSKFTFNYDDISSETSDSLDLKKIDSLIVNPMRNITVIKGFSMDSISQDFESHNVSSHSYHTFLDSIKIEDTTLTNKLPSLMELTSKVFFSITNDTIKLKKIDSLLKIEFNRKKIDIDYGLTYKAPNDSIQTLNNLVIKKATLNTLTKSTFLPDNAQLKIHFKNETKIILKRILSGILLSTLLVLAVISCLFYMLKVINRQKQIAEIKNDLISNITHEFKTPIATISVALESINSFNVINDKEKTKKYIQTSSNQLNKLNTMVEKLLETATLDSENLELTKENTNLVALLEQLIEKHNIAVKTAPITLETTAKEIIASIDRFHFENAVNNIIDNAIKYGGDKIWIEIEQNNNASQILISDSGKTLNQETKKRIFEKFYRVPKGNTHDVKGFGIGLFYTKQIIDKHNGTVTVSLKNNTTFKITIPNG